jgi:hypothetical protein
LVLHPKHKLSSKTVRPKSYRRNFKRTDDEKDAILAKQLSEDKEK